MVKARHDTASRSGGGHGRTAGTTHHWFQSFRHLPLDDPEHPPPPMDAKPGCLPSFLYVLFGIWVLIVAAGVWMNASWKAGFQVDVSPEYSWVAGDGVAYTPGARDRRLPTDGGQPQALALLVGVPCLVATARAVRANRGGRRSRRAIAWAFVFASIAAVAGAVVWAGPTNITCDVLHPGSGPFPSVQSFTSAPCPSDYAAAAAAAVHTIGWAAAASMLLGAVSLIVVTWIARHHGNLT